MSRLAVPAAALALVTLCIWVGLRSGGAGERPVDIPQRAAAEPAGVGGAEFQRPTEVAAPVRRVEAARGYDDALATVTGRLVDESGAPVAGATVALLEFATDRLELGEDVLVAEARSAGDGRFALPRARPDAQHLVVARSGAAPPLVRIVEAPLGAGAATDVGALAFPRTTRLSGRIVDARGEPVSGARVRVGTLRRWHAGGTQRPEELLALRPGQLVYASGRLGEALLDPRALVEILETYAPFARAETDAGGHFTFDAAPLAGPDRALVVDHPRRPPRAFTLPEDLADVGDLALRPERSLSGFVLDASGAPVADAEVLAGRFGWSLAILPSPAALLRAGVTDARGAFTLDGLPAGEKLVVAARRGAGQPFEWLRVKKDVDDVRMFLAPGPAALEVVVRGPGGAPLDGAQVVLFPRDQGAPPWLAATTRARASARGDGRYTFEHAGEGRLEVRRDGYHTWGGGISGAASARVEPVDLVPVTTRTLQLRDARSGAPVRGARVLVGGRALRADDDGRVALGEPARCRVEHPRYGRRVVHVPPLDVETLALEPCGAVALEVVCDGGLPAPVTLELQRVDGATSFLDRRYATTDADGRVVVPTLPPGTWRYRLLRRFLDQDVLVLAARTSSPSKLKGGELVVLPDATTPLCIELTREAAFPDLWTGDASLTGFISFDGVVPREARLRLTRVGTDGFERATELHAHGAFAFAELPAGSYRARLDYEGRRRFDPPDVQLAPGEERVVDWRWRSCTVAAHVVDASGAPVPEASVFVTGLEARTLGLDRAGSTSEQGRLELVVPVSGRCSVFARADELGHHRREVVLEPGVRRELKLVLDPGVPLGGLLTLEDGLAPPREEWPQNWGVQYSPMLVQFASDVDPDARGGVRLDPALPGLFEFVGFPPGGVTVTPTGFLVELAPLHFDLPPAGAPSLQLHLAR